MQSPEYATIFEGDGRCNVSPKPEWHLPGALKTVRRGQARLLAQLFEERRASFHSEAGHVVWVIVAYCRMHGYNYRVEGGPSSPSHQGWQVVRGKDFTRVNP